jgi:DNA-binding NtrC family response regulator
MVCESLEIGDTIGCGHCNGRGHYIEQLGHGAGRFFEEAFRLEYGVAGPLGQDAYADLIVGLKNRIGGNFSRASGTPGMVRVRNTRCPFGESVKKAPELCRMTSSVFGGIAARNFGYAKVCLEKRIAVGDEACEVTVVLDRGLAADRAGDEYHRDAESENDGEISSRVAERFYLAWQARDAAPHKGRPPPMVAVSPSMRKVMETIRVVAPTTATVLIEGETGVGKELVARAVHALSPRGNKSFVAVNCGAIPESLLESALFGHEKGAFTGAYEVHHGFFERAEGGTLFLDEADSLTPAAQVRLLRVLQDGEYERVGGKLKLRADVRVLVASGRSLARLAAEGKFREDLYYRLNVVPVVIPPVRQRRDDIPYLVEHILDRLAAKYGKRMEGVSDSVMRQIMSHAWPGNVREMENVLERSFLFCRGRELDRLLDHGGEQFLPGDSGTGSAPDLSLRDARKHAAMKAEEAILRENLQRFGGNVNVVARALRLSSRAVHQKLAAHRIKSAVYRTRPEPPRDVSKSSTPAE